MKPTTAQLLRALETYRDVDSLHVSAYKQFSQVRDVCKQGGYSLKEMADLLLILRETSRLVEDLRKEIDGVRTIMENVCCAMYIKANVLISDPIRGTFVTATPDVRFRARVPKRRDDPEKYAALMAHFGVKEKFVEQDLVRLHWVSFGDYLTRLAADGKPLPPGIKQNDTYAVYNVLLKQRQDLNEVLDRLDAAAVSIKNKFEDQTHEDTETAYEEILTTKPRRTNETDETDG